MLRKERPSLGRAWARWTTRHPGWVVSVVVILTLFFAHGLGRIQFASDVLDFYRPESVELIRTIETDFEQGDFLAIIFEAKNEELSLLEPRLLHQQFRTLQAIRNRFPVDTVSLVDAIDEGLRRVKGRSLLEVSDYTEIAQGILALSGGCTVRDLEKVTRNLLSHPEAIGFYGCGSPGMCSPAECPGNRRAGSMVSKRPSSFLRPFRQ